MTLLSGEKVLDNVKVGRGRRGVWIKEGDGEKESQEEEGHRVTALPDSHSALVAFSSAVASTK